MIKNNAHFSLIFCLNLGQTIEDENNVEHNDIFRIHKGAQFSKLKFLKGFVCESEKAFEKQ